MPNDHANDPSDAKAPPRNGNLSGEGSAIMGLAIRIRPEEALKEVRSMHEKMTRGMRLLSEIRDSDVKIGTTAKEAVFERDKVVLYRYKPIAEAKPMAPVLLVYALVGRYTMVDLQEDRSLVRNLLGQGVDVYVLDWGHPSRADRFLTIDDYVDGYIADAVDFICAREGRDRINLQGICEGGVFAVCYAALNPDRVENLVLTVTPIDFHADKQDTSLYHGFINLWTRSLAPEDIDGLIEAFGNLPGELMGSVFSMMTPMKSLTKYNLGLMNVIDDKKKLMNFLRMEKWLADRPHHPGEAAKQWLKDLYQDNKLIRNAFELGGRTVDLKRVRMPVLNIFATDDHIVPPLCSRALGKCVGTEDYTELELPGGHVGVFVSGRTQGVLGQGVVSWLSDRYKRAARDRPQNDTVARP